MLVLTQGDTLRGEVEDNAWEEAPAQVRYRPAAGAPATAYPAAALRSFRLNGGPYFRYELLPLDRTARTELSQLPPTQAHYPHPESLLAEVLVEGPASLLRTQVSNAWHYFVRREALPCLELSERMYLRDDAGRPVVMNGNNYRAELGGYLADCPAALQALAGAPFTAAGLAAVVQAYNRSCAATHRPGAEYLTKGATARTSAVNLGVVLGARYSSLVLHAQQGQGLEAPVLDGVNEDGSVHPVGGLYADLLNPGRRIALHAAVLLSTFGRDGDLPANAAGTPGRFTARGKLTEFRLGLRFFWPVGRYGRRVLVGTGLTVARAWGDGKDYGPLLGYGPNYSRTVSGVAVLTQSQLPNATPTGGPLPYLEVGLRQGRLTLLLDGRLLSNDRFTDGLAVRSLYTSPGSTAPDSYNGYDYASRRWFVSTTLGFGLLRQR